MLKKISSGECDIHNLNWFNSNYTQILFFNDYSDKRILLLLVLS